MGYFFNQQTGIEKLSKDFFLCSSFSKIILLLANRLIIGI